MNKITMFTMTSAQIEQFRAMYADENTVIDIERYGLMATLNDEIIHYLAESEGEEEETIIAQYSKEQLQFPLPEVIRQLKKEKGI